MKKTRSKIILVLSIVLISMILALSFNVILSRNTIEDYTTDYIVSQGYPVESIREIGIKHSYLNRILGYNEWRFFAEFYKEPNITFWFSYRNGEIIFEGVASEQQMDKDETIEYCEKFKNGTLLDD